MYENSLYHHGILGQKWGKRNGPPYPLNGGGGSGISSKGKAVAKTLGGAASAVKSKAKKTVYGNKRSEQAPKKTTPLTDEEKEKVIRSGDASKVNTYKYELTRKEMEEAMQRVNWQKNLDGIKYSPSTEFIENLKVYKDGISTVSSSIALYFLLRKFGNKN